MSNQLLPLGSILYLKEGTTKLMVVGRGPIFQSEGTDAYTDYVGVIYPEGINPEDAIFFNNEDVDKVVFEGYSDDEEKRFMEVYQEWEDSLTIPKQKAE